MVHDHDEAQPLRLGLGHLGQHAEAELIDQHEGAVGDAAEGGGRFGARTAEVGSENRRAA